MNQQSRKARIIRQTFQIVTDQYLHKQILFLPLPPGDTFVEISLLITHRVPSLSTPISSKITFNFPLDYPHSPPCMQITGLKGVLIEIPNIIIQSPLLASANWKPETTLRKVLIHQIQLIDAYWQSYFGFGAKPIFFHNESHLQKEKDETEFRHHTIDKLIIFHLKQIAKEIPQSSKQQFLSQIQIQQIQNKPLMQLLDKILSIEDFKNKLKKSLENGQWIHSILKGIADLRVKKELIREQGILLHKIEQLEIKNKQNQIKQYHQQCL